MGVTLMITKDTFDLENIRSRDLLLDRIAIIIGVGDYPDGAIDKEIELGAGFTRLYYRTTRGHLHKTETGMASDDLQIITTHALEQGKQKKFLINLPLTSVPVSIPDFTEIYSAPPDLRLFLMLLKNCEIYKEIALSQLTKEELNV